jgi:hypothetical protein
MKPRNQQDAVQTTSERRICGVKTRQGGRCQNRPVTGRERCRMHGGKQKRGPEHHSYLTGSRSRFVVPPKLAATMQRIAAAGDILSGTDRILLLSARQADLVEGLASAKTEAEVAKIWDQALAIDAQLDRVITSEVRRLTVMHEMLPVSTVMSHMLALIDSVKRVVMSTPKLDRQEQSDLIVRVAGVFKASLGDRMPSDLLTSGNGR